MEEQGRDLVWDAMVTWVERARREGRADHALGAGEWREGLRVVHGFRLWTGAEPRYLEEPVRWRWLSSSRWHEVRSVAEAANRMGAHLPR